MNVGELLSIISFIWLHLVRAEERVLNEYIRHYEELDYDMEQLHRDHQRVRRSLREPYMHFLFQAHGRSFNLRLRRDTRTFMPDVYKENDLSHIYEGEIWGEPTSKVFGSVIAGRFSGRIHTRGQTYHVESADKYFDQPSFASVIYDEKDMVLDPHRKKREAHRTGCGTSDPKIADWMKSVQNSAVETPPKIKKKLPVSTPSRDEAHAHVGHSAHSIYSDPKEAHNRVKRARRDRTTCTLFLQSDTMLWERMVKPRDSNGLGYLSDRAREEITSLFAQHVSGIRDIYEDTVFKRSDGSVSYKGISFVVRRIKINETSRDCPKGEFTKHNLFCRPNIDVSNFLNINSLNNHNDFCLAYVFSYRDFTGGTLGLAWVGSPTRASGGICEKYKEYQENRHRVSKSLNTGIVTLINYNSPVPPKVSTLTFAHEVGHNFGSPHDSGVVCTPFSAVPSNPKGNYIMYASATSGDRPNNSKFSPCSIGNVTQVLEAVFSKKNGKDDCFKPREEAFCGNNIVEEEGEKREQCDCGYIEDCEDKCCFGRGSATDKACQLRPLMSCSPSQGPCCTKNCNKVEAGSLECSIASDCNGASFCNGMDASCPTPEPKRNMTPCNEHTQICINGECRGSICQLIGWEQCFLEAPTGEKAKTFDKGNLCYVACRDPKKKSSACISTGAYQVVVGTKLEVLLERENQTSIKLPPGAPCNNFQGYCDVFQKCRDVDANGPLSRLKKLLFNEKTFNEIRNWIIEHWWAVLLMGMGLIIFMGIFIQVCAVHTPSSNPKKRPARKLVLPRPRNQGPPPPYVAGPSRGGPPHGKGRGPGSARQGQFEMYPQKV